MFPLLNYAIVFRSVARGVRCAEGVRLRRLAVLVAGLMVILLGCATQRATEPELTVAATDPVAAIVLGPNGQAADISSLMKVSRAGYHKCAHSGQPLPTEACDVSELLVKPRAPVPPSWEPGDSHYSGTVLVEAIISREGVPICVEPLKSNLPSVAIKGVISGFYRLRFEPPHDKRSGAPVACYYYFILGAGQTGC
jgi:hypothetical protein